jgi:hypothetical protein
MVGRHIVENKPSKTLVPHIIELESYRKSEQRRLESLSA